MMDYEDVKRIRENPTAKDVDNKELHRLIDIAIEKQIPKKPIEDEYRWAVCPICGGSVYLSNIRDHILDKETTYCEHCGQALDWSDTE